MKRVSLVLFSFILIAFAGSAWSKPAKEDVYHCGCNSDGTDLVWSGLGISPNGKGHRNHEAGDLEDCYAWVYDPAACDGAGCDVWTYIGTYTRDYSDCEAAGGPDVSGVDDCFSASGVDFEPFEGDFQTVGGSCSD